MGGTGIYGGASRRACLGPGTALVLLFSAQAALAQSASPPTREEVRRGDSLPGGPSAPARLTVDGGVERAACPLAAPQFANITVNFSVVTFAGLKVVDPAALADSWGDMAGRDMPIAALCDVRDRAATALRAMGYLAAVQVPPQRIEKGGTVALDVVMAKLVGIQVRGQTGNSEDLIAAQLQSLREEPVFNVRQAERALLLARDLPGYDVRLTLRPAGTAPGEVVGEVRVERERVRVDANVQNLGSHAVGRWGALARVQINDLTGMGDASTISLFNTLDTREQSVLQLGHAMALNADGMRLSGDFTYAWSRPDVTGGNIKSETLIAQAALSYPLVRSQVRNLMLSGGLEWVDQDVRFAGAPLTRDHLRVAYARADADLIDPASFASTTGYSAREPRWRLSGAVEIRHGIAGLGASRGCVPASLCAAPNVRTSRVEGDPSAFVLRAQAAMEWRPVPVLTLAFAPRAQYSPAALMSFEEFSVGTYTVGRGYDAGTITGDNGVGFAAEVRALSAIPSSPRDLAVQPFAFFDAGWVWNRRNPLAALDHQKLFSAGGGLRATWGNRGRVELTVAQPLDRTLSQKLLAQPRGDTRVLFSLTTQILPWRP